MTYSLVGGIFGDGEFEAEDAEDAIDQLHAMIAECWPDSVLDSEDGVDAHETENGDIWGEWSEGSLGRNRGLLMKLQAVLSNS
jgi:hypothetical protein